MKNKKQFKKIEEIIQSPHKINSRSDLEGDNYYFNPCNFFKKYIDAINDREKELNDKNIKKAFSVGDFATASKKYSGRLGKISRAYRGKKSMTSIMKEKQTGGQNISEEPKKQDDSGPTAEIRKQYPGAKIVASPVKSSNISNSPSTKPKKAIAVVRVGMTNYYVYPGSGGKVNMSSTLQHPEFLYSGKADDNRDYHAYLVPPTEEEVYNEAKKAEEEKRNPKTIKSKVMYYDNKLYDNDGDNIFNVQGENSSFKVSHNQKAIHNLAKRLKGDNRRSFNIISGGSLQSIKSHHLSNNTKAIKEEYKKFLNGLDNNLSEEVDKYKAKALKEGTNIFNTDKFKDIHGNKIFGKDWDNIKLKLSKRQGIKNKEDFKNWIKDKEHIDKDSIKQIEDFVNKQLDKIENNKSENIIKDNDNNVIFNFNKEHPIDVLKDKNKLIQLLNSKTVEDAVNLATNKFYKEIKSKMAKGVQTAKEGIIEKEDIKQELQSLLTEDPSWLINFNSNISNFKSQLSSNLYYKAKNKYNPNSTHIERGVNLTNIIKNYLNENNKKPKDLTFNELINYINSNKEIRTSLSATKEDKKIKNANSLISISNRLTIEGQKGRSSVSGDTNVGDEIDSPTLLDMFQYDEGNTHHFSNELEEYIYNMEQNEPKEEALNKKEQMFKDLNLNDVILGSKEDFQSFIKGSDKNIVNKNNFLDQMSTVLEAVYGNNVEALENEFDKLENLLKESSPNKEDMSIDEANNIIDNIDIENNYKNKIKEQISKGALTTLDKEKRQKYIDKRELVKTIANTSNKMIEFLSNVDHKGNKGKNVKYEDSIGFIASNILSPFMETFKNVGFKKIENPNDLKNKNLVSPSDVLKDYNNVFKNVKNHPIKNILSSFIKNNKGFYFHPEKIWNYIKDNNIELDENNTMMLSDMLKSSSRPSTIPKMLSKHYNKTSFTNFGKYYAKPTKYLIGKTLGELYNYAGLTREADLKNNYISRLEENMKKSDGIPKEFKDIADQMISFLHKEIKGYDDIQKINKEVEKALKFNTKLSPKAINLIKALIYIFEYGEHIINTEKIEEATGDFKERKHELIDKINELKKELEKRKRDFNKDKELKEDHLLYPKTQKPRGSYPNRHRVKYNKPNEREKSMSNLPITQRKKKLFEKSTLTKIDLLPEKGVSFIIGKIKNDPEKRVRVQSVLFNQNKELGKSWDLKEAKSWIKNNKEKIKKAIKYSEFIKLYKAINNLNEN